MIDRKGGEPPGTSHEISTAYVCLQGYFSLKDWLWLVTGTGIFIVGVGDTVGFSTAKSFKTFGFAKQLC